MEIQVLADTPTHWIGFQYCYNELWSAAEAIDKIKIVIWWNFTDPGNPVSNQSEWYDSIIDINGVLPPVRFVIQSVFTDYQTTEICQAIEDNQSRAVMDSDSDGTINLCDGDHDNNGVQDCVEAAGPCYWWATPGACNPAVPCAPLPDGALGYPVGFSCEDGDCFKPATDKPWWSCGIDYNIMNGFCGEGNAIQWGAWVKCPLAVTWKHLPVGSRAFISQDFGGPPLDSFCPGIIVGGQGDGYCTSDGRVEYPVWVHYDPPGELPDDNGDGLPDDWLNWPEDGEGPIFIDPTLPGGGDGQPDFPWDWPDPPPPPDPGDPPDDDNPGGTSGIVAAINKFRAEEWQRDNQFLGTFQNWMAESINYMNYGFNALRFEARLTQGKIEDTTDELEDVNEALDESNSWLEAIKNAIDSNGASLAPTPTAMPQTAVAPGTGAAPDTGGIGAEIGDMLSASGSDIRNVVESGVAAGEDFMGEVFGPLDVDNATMPDIVLPFSTVNSELFSDVPLPLDHPLLTLFSAHVRPILVVFLYIFTMWKAFIWCTGNNKEE